MTLWIKHKGQNSFNGSAAKLLRQKLRLVVATEGSAEDREKIAVAFWSKVEKRKPDECWPWLGYKNWYGYGLLCLYAKGLRKPHAAKASRISYWLNVGPIQPGMCICHHCDNPTCVNPDHLFIGTHLDNARDRIAKGRGNCPMRKLTATQAMTIYLAKQRGVSTSVLAQKYNVDVTAIKNIWRRITWKRIHKD